MRYIISLLYTLKESKYNPFALIHSLFYAATVTYLRIAKQFLRIKSSFIRNRVTDSFHGKVLPLKNASKFITINKSIELRNLEKVHPFRSRRIGSEEALKILKEENDRGYIHTAWFNTPMLTRFYALCNCCEFCCLGMKCMKEYNMKVVSPSGYKTVIDDSCNGCGVCADYCQFHAIEMTVSSDGEQKAKVIDNKCYGCGVCESKCKNESISLLLSPEKGMPLDIEELAKTDSI